MFPERSEGDALAGSPPEETPVDASQVSDDVASAASTADSVEESAVELTSSDDASSEGEASEASDEPEAEDEAADAPAEEPTEVIVVAAEAAEDSSAEAVEDHSDDPHHWDGPSVPFVPHHALLEGMMALAFLTFGLIFVAMVPAPLESRANPYLSPEGVLPEWYLMAPFELLHLVPPLPGMLGVGAAVGVLMLWPFIDRHPRRITRRPFVLALSFLIIAAILALSIIPYVHTGE